MKIRMYKKLPVRRLHKTSHGESTVQKLVPDLKEKNKWNPIGKLFRVQTNDLRMPKPNELQRCKEQNKQQQEQR